MKSKRAQNIELFSKTNFKNSKNKMLKKLLFIAMLTTATLQAQQYSLLVGGYTNKQATGIQYLNIDLNTFKYSLTALDNSLKNPSFLAIDEKQQFVYAIGEAGDGEVSAFSFDSSNPKLVKLNTQSTLGKGACFVSCTPQHVAASNYSAGSISVFERKSDGSVSPAVQHIAYTGSSVHPSRQKQAYAHQAHFFALWQITQRSRPWHRHAAFIRLRTKKQSTAHIVGQHENARWRGPTTCSFSPQKQTHIFAARIGRNNKHNEL